MRPELIQGLGRGWKVLFLAPAFLLMAVDCSTIIDIPNLLPLVNWSAIPYFSDLISIRKQFDALQTNGAVLPTIPQEEETKMNVPQLIEHLGFPVEVHHVITEDGYILELHRIPRGRGVDKSSTPGEPVYVQHGIAASSADFTNNLANESLAYVLADNGYDVWLGNSRGNTYSTNHTTKDTKEKAFWDFSYDEIAKYDVPAIIDYVLEKTSKSQLSYIGHSQGTTVGFALFSTNHDYDKKVKRFIALAPVTALTHMKCAPCVLLAPFANQINTLLTAAKVYSLLGSSDFTKFIGNSVCAGPVINNLCVGLFDVLFGVEGPQFNKTRLPVYYGQYPGGTSVKSLVHYGQNHNKREFSHFDYGLVGNFYKYGSIFAPNYNIEEVKVPTAMIYGSGDFLADPIDVEAAAKKLRKAGVLIEKFTIKVPGYTHVDIVWSTAPVLPVNDDVLEILALP